MLNVRELRSSSHHPLKRRAEGEYDSSKPSSDEHSVDKDPHFDREALVPSDSTFQRTAVGSIKRLFDPNIDNPSALLVGRNIDQKHISSTRRISDFRALVFRSKKIESESKDDSLPKLEYGEGNYIQEQLRYNDKSHENARSNASRAPLNESASADQIYETNLKPEPTMISQPETRSIFVDQLFAELRDIQTGLKMIEIKCIEVDERQSVAAQEKDSSRKNKLSNDQ